MTKRRRTPHVAKRSPARRRKPPTWWHLPFGDLIEQRCPAWVEVQLEVLLQRQPQRLDHVYLLRAKSSRDPSDHGRVLRGLWEHIRVVGLGEFKSTARPFRTGDLYRLAGCGWTWLHQHPDLAPGDLVLVLLVADRNDALVAELARCGATLGALGDGYHRASVGALRLIVVELDAVAEAEKDEYVKVFGHDPSWSPEVVQWLDRYTTQEHTVIDPKQLDGWDEAMKKIARSVPLKHRLEGLTSEQRAELAQGLKPEERLRGLRPEERLRGLKTDDLAHALKPEDRLVGLSEIEQVLALPPHLLLALSDEYIASLPPDVRATVRARRGR